MPATKEDILRELGETDGTILIKALEDAQVPFEQITLKRNMLSESVSFKPALCPAFDKAKLKLPTEPSNTCHDFVVEEKDGEIKISTAFNYSKFG